MQNPPKRRVERQVNNVLVAIKSLAAVNAKLTEEQVTAIHRALDKEVDAAMKLLLSSSAEFKLNGE